MRVNADREECPMSTGFATVSVASILVEAAKRTPDNVALVVGDTSTTYAELWQETRQYAGALRDRGVEPGTPVAMLIPNVADFPRVYYAILALGGVVVPIHALLKGKEIEYVLRDSGAELLVCAAPLLAEGAKGAALAGIPVVSVLLPEASPELPARLEDEARASIPIDTYVQRGPFDTATILYTSGTTGTPKGAEGSHFALVEQVNVSLLTTFDMQEGDRVLGALPLFHTFGQTCTMNAVFRAGATLILLPRFSGPDAMRLLNEHACTIFMGVPTMYISLLHEASTNATRPPLRYCVSGGAALPGSVIDSFRAQFDTQIHEGYGLTETAPVAAFNHTGQPPRPGTIGTAIWGVKIQIADPVDHDHVV